MKISEFIGEYDACPICNSVLDYIIYFEFNHTISYKKIAEVKDGFEFKQIAEKSARYEISHRKTCIDCLSMPELFVMKDNFSLPEKLKEANYAKKHRNRLGFAFLGATCLRHDFSRYSTEFDIFSTNHDIDIFDEAFDIDSNTTIINDYTTDKTIIKTNNSIKRIKLIPLTKWGLYDKPKLIEKVNKLLVLL